MAIGDLIMIMHVSLTPWILLVRWSEFKCIKCIWGHEQGVGDIIFMLAMQFVNAVSRTGQISAQEFMTFMISRETENVDSAQEVEEAFQAITAGGERPYVTEAELYQASTSIINP